MHKLPQLQIWGEISRQEGQKENKPSFSSDSNPTIASLRNQKTRSLQEIYAQNDDMDEETHFALLLCKSIYFEEAVK